MTNRILKCISSRLIHALSISIKAKEFLKDLLLKFLFLLFEINSSCWTILMYLWKYDLWLSIDIIFIEAIGSFIFLLNFWKERNS